MHTQHFSSPRRLSDGELIARVSDLACRERQATAALVVHLAELDERKLYLAEGCSSLFTYCTEILHLSEAAAYKRIEAARVARKFPAVAEKLADGSVHLTAVRLLSLHLTEENHRDLLDRATHKSKREIEELIARIHPLPAVPSSVRKLPARETFSVTDVPALEFTGEPAGANSRPEPAPDPVSLAQSGSLAALGQVIPIVPAGNSPAATPAQHRSTVAPLAPELYRIQFTADEETHALLSKARELLRHEIPDGDPAAVIGLALKVLVGKLKQQKFAARRMRKRADETSDNRRAGSRISVACDELPQQPQPSRPLPRHIPAEVRRRVWNRDQGRCAFIGRNGRRCSERGCLEFHHVRPFAQGGPATVENIQLRCRAHNAYEAELTFGSRLMLRRKQRRRELAPGRVETSRPEVVRGDFTLSASPSSREVLKWPITGDTAP